MVNGAAVAGGAVTGAGCGAGAGAGAGVAGGAAGAAGAGAAGAAGAALVVVSGTVVVDPAGASAGGTSSVSPGTGIAVDAGGVPSSAGSGMSAVLEVTTSCLGSASGLSMVVVNGFDAIETTEAETKPATAINPVHAIASMSLFRFADELDEGSCVKGVLDRECSEFHAGACSTCDITVT